MSWKGDYALLDYFVKPCLRWLRQSGALAIIVSFLGCAGSSELIASVKEPEIGVPPRAFEHIIVLNSSKDIDSGFSVCNLVTLFLGDPKIFVSVEAESRSHWSNASCCHHAQIIWDGREINFNVIRKCNFIAWRQAEILKYSSNSRDSAELKHCDIRRKDIGPQLRLRSLRLISCDENEPSCNNSEKNRGDSCNRYPVVIKGIKNLNEQERKKAIGGALFMFGCLIVLAYLALKI